MSEEPKKRWYQISIKRTLVATAIVAFGVGLYVGLCNTSEGYISLETLGVLLGLSILSPFLAVGVLFRHPWTGVIIGALIGGCLGYVAWSAAHA